MRVHTGRANRGATLIEFALIAVLMMLVIFASFEFGRMLLVYSSIANAAHVACRYAITHGGSNSQAATLDEIRTVAKNFAGTAPLNIANLRITVSPTPPLGAPGSTVSVTVTYPYDPFTILPLTVTLGSTSQGVITF